ncbi:hypothetical protein AB1Y20_023627 [Prymnesium parvum]|uniref:Armadillo repeat-containing protein 8 n=1 Tax=Prymnesium parvum TaxID=97485 RepID=A0AB34JFX8_PRYPA
MAALLGSAVVLKGLSRAELNDARGHAVSYDESTGRVGVRLASGRCVAVRLANLSLLVGSEAVDLSTTREARLHAAADDLNELLDGEPLDALRAHLAQRAARPGCAPSPRARLAGGAAALVEAVGGEGGEAVAAEACLALAKLAGRGARGKEAVIAAGGAAALAAAAGGRAGGAAWRALASVANGGEACKRAVVEAGVARRAADAARRGEDRGVLRLCCATLANLANGEACSGALVEAGAAAAVVGVMKRFPGEAELIGDACLALANLASHKQGGGAESVCEADGVAMVVKAVRALGESSPKVRHWGSAALVNLASNNGECKEAVIESGGVGAAVHLLQICPCGEAEAQKMAAGVLTHISSSGEAGRHEVTATGGVAAATKCMSTADDVPLIEECMRAVASMVFASDEDFRTSAIPAVLENILLRFPTEPRVQDMGRALLTRLGR